MIYDPKTGHTLRGAELHSRAGYTPFEGFETSGSIRSVYLRGMLTVDHGEIVGERRGEYLAREKCML